MNDERFFDLAMKVIARQATDAERAELDAVLAREPDLRAEFERLQADARTARDALPLLRTPNAPVIQVAMLDTAGAVRGSDTNEIVLLRETLSPATLDSFTSAEALREWETKIKVDAVRIIYDRAAAEVRVAGYAKGKAFQRAFPVEKDLAATLRQVSAFIKEQTRR